MLFYQCAKYMSIINSHLVLYKQQPGPIIICTSCFLGSEQWSDFVSDYYGTSANFPNFQQQSDMKK